MVTTTPGLATRARAGHWLARSLVVAGLAVDVAVHWHLAAQFDPLKSSVSSCARICSAPAAVVRGQAKVP